MGDTPTNDGRDRSEEAAKLELPSLSLRRRKKKAKADETPVEREPEPPTDALSGTPVENTTPTDPTPDVVAAEQLAPPPEPDTSHAPVPDHEPVDLLDDVAPQRKAARRRSLPTLNPRIAAAVTGLVVGAFGALLVYLSLQGCEAIKGTESCGGSGVLAIVAILVVMVLLGGIVLALWSLPEPRSTSFLAIGVLCVVMMLTLIQQLFSVWMFLVVPILSGLAFVLAHWVTTTFVEPAPEKGPEHDVR